MKLFDDGLLEALQNDDWKKCDMCNCLFLAKPHTKDGKIYCEGCWIKKGEI